MKLYLVACLLASASSALTEATTTQAKLEAGTKITTKAPQKTSNKVDSSTSLPP